MIGLVYPSSWKDRKDEVGYIILSLECHKQYNFYSFVGCMSVKEKGGDVGAEGYEG